VPGNAIIGYLSDRYPIRSVIALNCLGTALACFFLWGFGTTAAALVAFVLIFGVLGLGFVSVWTRMISMIASASRSVLSLEAG
jgi:predicted MFS family arabinose efflux permease